MPANRLHAIAYLRTSSASGLGEDRDSQARQRRAISAYAKRARYELVAEFADEAVRGADLIETREGFKNMLGRIAGNRRLQGQPVPHLVPQRPSETAHRRR